MKKDVLFVVIISITFFSCSNLNIEDEGKLMYEGVEVKLPELLIEIDTSSFFSLRESDTIQKKLKEQYLLKEDSVKESYSTNLKDFKTKNPIENVDSNNPFLEGHKLVLRALKKEFSIKRELINKNTKQTQNMPNQ